MHIQRTPATIRQRIFHLLVCYLRNTPRSTVLLEKLTVPQLAKKFLAFYGTRRFIAAFTKVRNLSHPQPDQSHSFPSSHLLNIHFNIILTSTPGSSKWYLPLRFPHQTLVRTSLISHTCHMLSPSHCTRISTEACPRR